MRLTRPPSGYSTDMVKTVIFFGGIACGFAASTMMTEEQRRRVTGRARSVASSDVVQRVTGAAHTAADAVVDTALTKVEETADHVAKAVGG